MLCILEKDGWGNAILEMKSGNFPSSCIITEMEKRIITHLTSHVPENRPQNMSDVIKIIKDLSNEGKNYFTFKPFRFFDHFYRDM